MITNKKITRFVIKISVDDGALVPYYTFYTLTHARKSLKCLRLTYPKAVLSLVEVTETTTTSIEEKVLK